MRILFTAFKGERNTSYQLVSRIAKPCLFLTNSFPGLRRDISLADKSYDAIIMFGIDKSLTNAIRIETCASQDGELLYSQFNIPALELHLKRNKIPYCLSDSPTHYLCNEAYYHMLAENPSSVFIHIPSAHGMTTDLMDHLLELFSQLDI